jgi:hypothetical protein
MIKITILIITFGFGFLTGAALGVVVMLKALRKTQVELESSKEAHKVNMVFRYNKGSETN